MRLLLDTHLLVWSLADDSRISMVLRDQLADPANAVFFSAASIWEVAIKHGLGRDDFRVPPVALERSARECRVHRIADAGGGGGHRRGPAPPSSRPVRPHPGGAGHRRWTDSSTRQTRS